jgi:hypothetical protein
LGGEAVTDYRVADTRHSAAVHGGRTRVGVGVAVLACGVGVIGVANTMTARDAVPALRAAYRRGMLSFPEYDR